MAVAAADMGVYEVGGGIGRRSFQAHAVAGHEGRNGTQVTLAKQIQ